MSLNLVPQLFVDGAWTTYAGYSEDGWELSVGPDVESGLRPNSLSFTLANDDLSMDPTNVRSVLYGKIGRNTRARMLMAGNQLTQAEASSWQPDATSEHAASSGRGKSWVDLQAEGLLRRLGRWTDPIRSAMTRQAASLTGLLGYWTLEDQSGAAQLSNEVAAGQAGSYAGTCTLQGDDGAGGADGAVKVGSDGALRGSFLSAAGNGYQVSWVAKLPAVPTSATYLPLFTWVDAQRRTWVWSVNNTANKVEIFDQAGVSLMATPFAYGAVLPNLWVRYRVKVTVSAGTLTYEPAIYLQDASTAGGVTDTFASATAGRPTTWKAVGNAWTDGAAFGHILATTDTTVNLLVGDSSASFNGYLGEDAINRYARLCGEEGLTRYVIGGTSAHSTKMGRQKPGIFLDLLTECAATEGGLIYDEPTDIALTFCGYVSTINRTPALALTKSQVMAPLRKTIDDVGVVNDVTVKNWDGSTSRVTLDSGALSTGVPPLGVGRVKATVDVNMSQTSQLASRANWEMRKGTLDRPRYLSVSVNLLANPSLSAAATLIRPGNWISISGVEPDTIYLRVISIGRKGDTVEDVVTFNCLPAELYQIGVYDQAASRYDSGSTTLAAAITTTGQTSISLTTANYNDRWSSTPGYDIKIAGERMTVTAMTTAAGTGPYTQTATVTRSVNGVTKTHAVNTEVHIFAPVRYALR